MGEIPKMFHVFSPKIQASRGFDSVSNPSVRDEIPATGMGLPPDLFLPQGILSWPWKTLVCNIAVLKGTFRPPQEGRPGSGKRLSSARRVPNAG